MYSSMDSSFGIVEGMTDPNRPMWLNDILDQQGIDVSDTNSWMSVVDVEPTNENCYGADWSNTGYVLPEPSSSHLWTSLRDYPTVRNNTAFRNPRATKPRSVAQDTPSPIQKGHISPVSMSAEQKERSQSSRRQSPSQSTVRTPHRVVERRYRNNLNAQIDLLASKLPKSTDGSNDAELYPKITSKATIMTNAISHIKLLEEKGVRSDGVVKELQGQIAGLQKLLRHDENFSAMRCRA